MASRFTLKPPHSNMLEIRGLSRGSLIEHSRNTPHSSLTPDFQIGTDGYYTKTFQNTPDVVSDDDDSTITGGSVADFPARKGEDAMTVSESSHYWSAANSFTTGNTTERSSLYSWGDDEFDHQAGRLVQDMFHAIEKMLFESVLSGSTLLQHECREWMGAFPHLRILGKQSHPVKDEGFQSVPSSQNASGTGTPTNELNLSSNFDLSDSSSLTLSGTPLTPTAVPLRYLISSDNSGELSGELSHLQEEIFEEDGEVEEYLAYDIREMDEEETAKRYHIPRRRRLGYPPITPNACVRDAVINQLFDITWTKLVYSLDNQKTSGQKTNGKSLWKVLFNNYQSAKKRFDSPTDGRRVNDSYLQINPKGPFAEGSNFQRYDEDENRGFGDNFPFTGRFHDGDRYVTSTALGMTHSEYFQSNFGHPPGARIWHDPNILPPSRGSYMDQNFSGGRQFLNSGRLSNVAYNPSDFASLDGVMKISRKKLQARSDRGQPLPNGESIESFESQHIDGGNMYGGMLTASGLNVPGPSSPQGLGGRSYISISGMTSRQPSAKYKARAGRPARLLPLDRAKTPAGFDGVVKATKLKISSGGPSNFSGPEIVGIRVTSPTGPPPTAPASSGGNLWVNSRLPPISLDPLNENSATEFKKPRGRTAHSRISSAIAEDTLLKQTMRGWEGVSRPNTTQAFRSDALKRTSITPSGLSSGPFGGPLTLQLGKTASPTGIPTGPLPSGNLFYSHTYGHSPDNHSPVLAGITGIGMLGNTNASHSPGDHDDDTRPVHTGWGNPIRRKKTVVGS